MSVSLGAGVTWFFGLAFAWLMGQLWTPLTVRGLDTACAAVDEPRMVRDWDTTRDDVHDPIGAVPLDVPRTTLAQVCHEVSVPPVVVPRVRAQAATPNKNAPSKKKKKAARAVAGSVPVDLRTAPLADEAETTTDKVVSDCCSNASTCGSSDEDGGDEEKAHEDLGEREMKLMLQRAMQIKRLVKQTRQPQAAQKRNAKQVKDALVAHLPAAQTTSPVRLTNKSTGLWRWSVHASSACCVELRVPAYEEAMEAALDERLENEEEFERLALQVLS